MYKIVESLKYDGHYKFTDEEVVLNLERIVNTYLSLGYYCVGGVSVVFDQEANTIKMYQSMIKKSTSED